MPKSSVAPASRWVSTKDCAVDGGMAGRKQGTQWRSGCCERANPWGRNGHRRSPTSNQATKARETRSFTCCDKVAGRFSMKVSSGGGVAAAIPVSAGMAFWRRRDSTRSRAPTHEQTHDALGTCGHCSVAGSGYRAAARACHPMAPCAAYLIAVCAYPSSANGQFAYFFSACSRACR